MIKELIAFEKFKIVVVFEAVYLDFFLIQSFRFKRVLFNDIFLGSKISLLVKMLLKFRKLWVFRAVDTPESQILIIDTVSQNKLNTIKIHVIWYL